MRRKTGRGPAERSSRTGTAVLAGSFKGLPAAAAQGPFVAAAVRGSHLPS